MSKETLKITRHILQPSHWVVYAAVSGLYVGRHIERDCEVFLIQKQQHGDA